jgi:TatD DNase family protein
MGKPFTDKYISLFMYSESHCHIGDMSIEDIEKAEKLGFTLLLTSGIDLPSSEQAVSTAQKHKIVKACVGVHPWYADEYNRKTEIRFKELAKDEECIAISEIGLDFVGRMTHEWIREETYIDPKIQYNTFKSQLNLAKKLKLPAIVHDRAPKMELIDILKNSENLNTGIAIHGYSKGLDYSKRCIDNGIYLSVGLRNIQAGNPAYLEAVKKTSIEYLLTETDSSKPDGVITVCKLIAELKGLTGEEVGKTTTRNLMKLCRL